MRFRFSALLIAFAGLAISSQLPAAPIDADGGAQVTGPFCGTSEVSRDEQLAVQRQVEDWLSENAAAAALGGNIKIAWHVIYSGTIGNIPQSMIDSTIVVLNRNFAGVPGGANTEYTFSLASVDRTDNNTWFNMEYGSNAENKAKRALAIDVPHRLNVYSCNPPSGINWATFTRFWTERDPRHGVVLHYGNLPGSYSAPFNTGDLAVHEVGHYLGLYHTFQGGCNPPGDEVADTPDEGVSAGSSCPNGRDSCPSAGVDPIHNYMDYTNDACKWEFTAGQDARMDTIVPMDRPNLLNAPFSPDGPAGEHTSNGRRSNLAPAAGVSFLGATPNPFRGTTEIRFAMSERKQVELKIYNAGGQLVTALVNGPMTAGDHAVTFGGQELPSGVYFAALRIDGQLITRSLVLKH
jgi:hypothetical protein